MDISADYISRETFIYSPIYRMRMTLEQFEELEKTVKQQRDYLDESKIPLIDYTENCRIKEEHYGKGDHLNRSSGRRLFISLLANDLSRNALLDSL